MYFIIIHSIHIEYFLSINIIFYKVKKMQIVSLYVIVRIYSKNEKITFEKSKTDIQLQFFFFMV